MKIQVKKLMLGALVVAGSVGMFSCNDDWDDHYSAISPSQAGPTLWEALQAPEYSAFKDILREKGYEALLSGKDSRIYTVFAPTNDAMSGFVMEDSLLEGEFIQNHISYFYQNVSTVSDTTVTMLNKKVMRLKSDVFGDRLNPNIQMEATNFACKNGLLQTLPQVVPYKSNIWEIIDKQGGKLKDYLFSYNSTILNKAQSTVGYVDTLGQTIYLDSVTRLYNPYWGLVGELNHEDSTYVSLIFDDQAWDEGYTKIEKNFKYYPELQYKNFRYYDGTNAEATIDSLARRKQFLIHDYLVAGMTFTPQVLSYVDPNSDFYRSVGYYQVPKKDVNEWLTPANSTPIDASNGKAYLTSKYLYEAADVWQDTITTECEDSYRLLSTTSASMIVTTPRLVTDTLRYSPLSTDYEKYKDKRYKVSQNQYQSYGGTYIYVKNATAQVAGATFGIANTLSGDYDVWVTFIPSKEVDGVLVRQNLVKGTLYYTTVENGVLVQNAPKIEEFEVDSAYVTRVKVGEIRNLAPCYAGFLLDDENVYKQENEAAAKVDLYKEKYGVKIQLGCAAGIRDEKYDHSLYIDCIELVPRRDN